MVDINPEHAGLQPENAIIIKPWEGKGGDQGLVDLIPFLECALIPIESKFISCTMLIKRSNRHLQPSRRPTDPKSVRG